MMPAGRIVVVAGPTATGKTGAAVELALRFGGEIVGADSVQVYRGFDIGSAKPAPGALRGVRHHLIDVADAASPLDAVSYAGLADRAIAVARDRGKLPIVCGGTGLWLRALLRGLVEVPPVDPEVRARLEREADAAGAPALHRRLVEVDPRAAARIHPNDRVRIVRALEVFEQTGAPMGELRARHALGGPRYDALFVVIDLARETLARRIAERTRAMIDAGWADEVRALVTRYGESARPLGSVGYREMVGHVLRGVPIDATERAIVKATRVYSRRQRTWFASEPGVDWRTDAQRLVDEAGIARIRQWLET